MIYLDTIYDKHCKEANIFASYTHIHYETIFQSEENPTINQTQSQSVSRNIMKMYFPDFSWGV